MFKLIGKYLEYGTKQSSMRLAMFFISIIFAGTLIFGSTTAIIIMAATKQTIEWTGYSLFIGSVATLSGVGLYFKKEQSKIESNGNNS